MAQTEKMRLAASQQRLVLLPAGTLMTKMVWSFSVVPRVRDSTTSENSPQRSNLRSEMSY